MSTPKPVNPPDRESKTTYGRFFAGAPKKTEIRDDIDNCLIAYLVNHKMTKMISEMKFVEVKTGVNQQLTIQSTILLKKTAAKAFLNRNEIASDPGAGRAQKLFKFFHRTEVTGYASTDLLKLIINLIKSNKEPPDGLGSSKELRKSFANILIKNLSLRKDLSFEEICAAAIKILEPAISISKPGQSIGDAEL